MHARPIVRAFLPFLARDLGLAGAMLALVVWDAAQRMDGEAGALAWIVGGACGVMVTLVSFLAHEWGHLLGAVASGGRVERPRRLATPFLFHYDTARSTRAQFLWMSAGGYLASSLCLAGVVGWADPASVSGLVALALTGIGVAVTLALEVPTTVRVARGAPLPTGGVYTE